MIDEPEFIPRGEPLLQPPFVITVTDANEEEDEFVSLADGNWIGPQEVDVVLTLDEVFTRIRGMVT